jgi:hypothetical protein
VATSTKPPTLASGTNWTTPNNALAEDDNHAAYTPASGLDYLVLRGFGFNLAQGAVISKIEVLKLLAHGDLAIVVGTTCKMEVALSKNASTPFSTLIATDEMSMQPSGDHVDAELGTSNAGTTSKLEWNSPAITYAEFNSDNFSLLVRRRDHADECPNVRHIDYAELKVTYTVPTVRRSRRVKGIGEHSMIVQQSKASHLFRTSGIAMGVDIDSS